MATQSKAPGVTVVVTSCGRHDLLRQSLDSFFKMNTYPVKSIVIVEDGKPIPKRIRKQYKDFPVQWISTDSRVGQVAAVDYAYSRVKTPYVFHMEDDWLFYAKGFIEPSLKILRHDLRCLLVHIRPLDDTSGHPVSEEVIALQGVTYRKMTFGYLGRYYGFSFNPGLRRLSDYIAIDGYGKWAMQSKEFGLHYEEMIAAEYYRRGCYAAILDSAYGYVRHLGDSRHIPSHDPYVSQS